MIAAIATPNHTGRVGAVFYICGTPTKRLCEWAELRGLIRYPSFAHRNHALAAGPKPFSLIDQLPDEPETVEAKGATQ